jgi:phosphoglucomutase
MEINALAGKPAPSNILTDIPKLITAYYAQLPDPSVESQRVAFGTSGHRGSSFNSSFNEQHILAITQAICFYRKANKIEGPLYLGFDTHALSTPAFTSAMEVLAANEVHTMIAKDDEYTPTPVISFAILKYNSSRKTGLADGIVITPSHNPPADGGFKYNPPNGGPAGTAITKWIENKANELLENGLKEVKRIAFNNAIHADTTHRYDYLNAYIPELGKVIDMDVIRDSKIKMGVDPLGGAGVHYWEPIAAHYKLDLTVVNKIVDPTFGFMTVDWDGKIRMDPSSPYAMQRLIKNKNKFDISFACDTDHDRHGIVTKSEGLLNPNHYLAVSIFYLLQNRAQWNNAAGIGKTVVSSQMIDKVAEKLKRKLVEVPVGFKWFVDGLLDQSLCFVGEESAGATFLRMDGDVWTTDKDGFIPALLSAEITAKCGKDPGEIYNDLTKEFGEPFYDRIEAKATPEQKKKLKQLSSDEINTKDMGGEKIQTVITNAPGNNTPIDGLRVTTEHGWFAARPSGTENIYKIYAESFLSKKHLHQIIEEAQKIVDVALAIKEKTI